MSDAEEPVGSVGEEAVKLLAALRGLATEHGGEYAEATAMAAAGAAAARRQLDEHLATRGEDCRYCPLCRLISAVRGTSPEVRAHLAAAAGSLIQAAAETLATPAADPSGRSEDRAEEIDLTDDRTGAEDD